MKPKKSIIRIATENLFDADVVLIVCEWSQLKAATKTVCDAEHFQELEKKIDAHGEQSFTKAVQFPFPGGGSVVWARPDARLSTLVHEITHAAHHLLSRRDTPLSEDTEEVYAYLNEFLFKSLVDSRSTL